MPIDLNRQATFFDYFKLNADPREIAQAFGYHFTRDALNLILAPVPDMDAVRHLQVDLQEIYRKVDIANEQARREFLIAPVLALLSKWIPDLWIGVEKYIVVNEQLKGSLDYYLTSARNLVVIEAKNADIVSGMKQLLVELIALDKLEEPTCAHIHGAVSIGDDWRFARLTRATQRITEDLKLYRVPEELDRLIGVLIGLLQPEQASV